MKLLLLAALAVVVWRSWIGRWPWQARRTPLADAGALLGVPANASRDDILAAHRALIARVHPDRGGSVDAVHAADAARDVLLARVDVKAG